MPPCRNAVLTLICASVSAIAADPAQDIIDQAAAKMQADWAAAPDFAFVQRDITTSKGVTTSKTHQVFMISGSDYYLPIAIDGKPLPEDRQNAELERLQQEVERRRDETPKQAAARSEKYRKLREQNEILLREFIRAFDFTAAGEETVNGRAAYVFDAYPRADYHPPNRTAKILAGMQGRLWIDMQSLHWLKAEAEALNPVSVFGIFARVLPGTRMELEMTPVNDSVWLVSRLVFDTKFSVFWHKSVRTTETTFSDYQPAAKALSKALTPKG